MSDISSINFQKSFGRRSISENLKYETFKDVFAVAFMRGDLEKLLRLTEAYAKTDPDGALRLVEAGLTMIHGRDTHISDEEHQAITFVAAQALRSAMTAPIPARHAALAARAVKILGETCEGEKTRTFNALQMYNLAGDLAGQEAMPADELYNLIGKFPEEPTLRKFAISEAVSRLTNGTANHDGATFAGILTSHTPPNSVEFDLGVQQLCKPISAGDEFVEVMTKKCNALARVQDEAQFSALSTAIEADLVACNIASAHKMPYRTYIYLAEMGSEKNAAASPLLVDYCTTKLANMFFAGDDDTQLHMLKFLDRKKNEADDAGRDFGGTVLGQVTQTIVAIQNGRMRDTPLARDLEARGLLKPVVK